MRLDLSIVIPAFNESQRITPTLRSVDAYLRTSNLSYEILVVDDGSTDATVAVVDSLREEIPQLRRTRRVIFTRLIPETIACR